MLEVWYTSYIVVEQQVPYGVVQLFTRVTAVMFCGLLVQQYKEYRPTICIGYIFMRNPASDSKKTTSK